MIKHCASKLLDHSSFDALVADLKSQPKGTSFRFERDHGAAINPPCPPWNFVAAVIIHGGAAIYLYGHLCSMPSSTVDRCWTFRLENGFLVRASAIRPTPPHDLRRRVVIADKPLIPRVAVDNSLQAQLNDNLERVFS